MRARCAWASDEPNITYHDQEWGRPQHDDRSLFEFLVLEGAQAGPLMDHYLNRRQAYRKAFSNLMPSKYQNTPQNMLKGLLDDASIIRNRLKIRSAVNNARQFLKIQKEFGSFDLYIWGFVNHTPIKNHFKDSSELPAFTETSKRLSCDLKARGFTFVGPTICYALMQAIGMVNDHTADCYLFQK